MLYKDTFIPQEVWNFFDIEPGLSTNQLTTAIDKRKASHPDRILNFFFQVLNDFQGYHLVKYYRDHPPFSVNKLLQYHAYATRDLITLDDNFKFHEWLLKHDLTIPSNLVHGVGWSSISYFCCNSGITYLSRKILSFPQSLWQTKLNELAQLDTCDIKDDINLVLADNLVSGRTQEFYNKTIEERFEIYKKRELLIANQVSEYGIHSLLWKVAKKVANQATNIDMLTPDCQEIVLKIRSFKEP